MRVLNVIALVVAISSVPVVQAAPIGDPSALSGDLTVITFEEFTLGTAGPLTSSGVTISSDAFASVVNNPFPQHPGIYEGQYFGQGAQSFFFEFDAPVRQFGVGIFDPNFVGNELRALDAANNVLESIFSPSPEFTTGVPGGAHSTFVGFVRGSADIARVELINAPGDLMGIDTVTFSAIGVPGPGAVFILVVGLAGFTGLRRLSL